MTQTIAVDLGGTFLRCALFDEGGGLSNFSRIRLDEFHEPLDGEVSWGHIISSIEEYVASVKDRVTPLTPIVVSFPGPVEANSRIVAAPTISGASTMIPDIVGALTAHTGRKVYLLNDMSAAAWHISRTCHLSRFMIITVSSGIGSKVFDHNHTKGVLDDRQYSGEIGHMVVDTSVDALSCDCGGKGHLGAISSGRGVERLARRIAVTRATDFDESICAKLCGRNPQSINNEQHVVPAALSGDKWTLDVIRASIEPLSEVLLAIILGVGLEKVIVSGGFAISLGTKYLEILKDALTSRSTPAPYRLPIADLIELDTDKDSSLLGAGAFASRLINQP